jgi:hypothetical protein
MGFLNGLFGKKQASTSSTIEGRVFRSDTNQRPIKTTIVLLDPTLADQNNPAFKVAETKTDDQGNYKFSNVKPGTYQMTFFALFSSVADLPFDEKEYGYISSLDNKWLLQRLPQPDMVVISGLEQEIRDGKASLKTFDIAMSEVLRKDIDIRCK